MKKIFLTLNIFLLVTAALLGGILWRVMTRYNEVTERTLNPSVVYRIMPAAQPIFSVADGVRAERESFLDDRDTLISEKKSFIEADLETMRLTLYENGVTSTTFPILTKGREGSWWETATGQYSAVSKAANHFSSIGHVWMPWSIQFYGNFFIHGWPYYEGGKPVEKTYTGGCIRLSTEDAGTVFRFVTRGTPILVFDQTTRSASFSALGPIAPNVPAPELSAEAVLVADIDTGETILDKYSGKPMPIASLTKLMTGVVASELVYLDRSIVVSPRMLVDTIQSFPLTVGASYRAIDLLYPLLLQSSNGSARALAGFLGEAEFIRQMNLKATALGMDNTTFADPSGVSEKNVSTLKDLARLSKYITDKRRFLFDLTAGKPMDAFSKSELSILENFNEFASTTQLVGMKNGETRAARQVLAGVWEFKTPDGKPRKFFIGVLSSENRKADTEALLAWLKTSFLFKP